MGTDERYCTRCRKRRAKVDNLCHWCYWFIYEATPNQQIVYG